MVAIVTGLFFVIALYSTIMYVKFLYTNRSAKIIKIHYTLGIFFYLLIILIVVAGVLFL